MSNKAAQELGKLSAKKQREKLGEEEYKKEMSRRRNTAKNKGSSQESTTDA